jgi:hypothetical protein
VTAAAAAAGAATAACDNESVHVYSAQLFVAAEGCLQPSTGLDLLSGPATGDNCAPACLTAPTADGEAVYVSTVCPPYPQGVTVEAANAAVDAGDPCVAALGALAARATCSEDAGGAADGGGG